MNLPDKLSQLPDSLQSEIVEYARNMVVDERERIANMCLGKPIKMDGGISARRGPGDVGTWHEGSSMDYTMRSLAKAIRRYVD